MEAARRTLGSCFGQVTPLGYAVSLPWPVQCPLHHDSTDPLCEAFSPAHEHLSSLFRSSRPLLFMRDLGDA